MITSLRELADALGGEVVSAQVLAPGPVHDRRDRSLSVKISASSPDGFLCHSFAGDNFKVCKDYVKSRLGMRQFEFAQKQASKPQQQQPDEKRIRIERARETWLAAVDPRGTMVALGSTPRSPAQLSGLILVAHGKRV
jgi:putative DNA primase/helicase